MAISYENVGDKAQALRSYRQSLAAAAKRRDAYLCREPPARAEVGQASFGAEGEPALLQAVTVVVDGHHAVAGLRAQVELLAHLADVGVDRARGEVAAAAPHRFLQMPARHEPADIAEEGDGELELLRRELDLRAFLAYFAALDVDLERRKGEQLLLFGGIGAPQQRAHAGEQLLAAHRLHHVVVGAVLEGENDVLLRVAHSDEQHRHASSTRCRAAR